MVSLAVNFRRSVIIVYLWQPEVAKPENFVSNFWVFLEKRPHGKIFIIPFLKFTSRQRSTLLWWNVLKFVRQEIWEIVHYLPYNNKKQNFGSLSPKIFQGQPPTFGLQSHCYRFHPNRFTFSGVIAECVMAILLPHRVCIFMIGPSSL